MLCIEAGRIQAVLAVACGMPVYVRQGPVMGLLVQVPVHSARRGEVVSSAVAVHSSGEMLHGPPGVLLLLLLLHGPLLLQGPLLLHGPLLPARPGDEVSSAVSVQVFGLCCLLHLVMRHHPTRPGQPPPLEPVDPVLRAKWAYGSRGMDGSCYHCTTPVVHDAVCPIHVFLGCS
jgi:hypothetical protein